MFDDLNKSVLPEALPKTLHNALPNAKTAKTSTNEAAAHEEYKDFYEEIHTRVAHFVNFVSTFPRIEGATENDKSQLRREMKMYLLAHISQCEDNVKLQAQDSVFLSPRSSYLKWMRSTAADHLSSQYTFAFITCLLGHSSNQSTGLHEDYFPIAEVKYVAQGCCTHLSVICSIYNDYGSLARDRQKNLNSVFFPEFEGKFEKKTDIELRQKLMRIRTMSANVSSFRLMSCFGLRRSM